ncbi:hypothetical protein EMIHUDRAFT_238756 [Emiliania huxleyi CCMP1516]|uniref:EXS domain-containing protein n=2 Tax=Emiliania huxleyi TaxID=2903 RepID=A0A0D3JL43_EMIH1|nr:hypothetical protein EMIHUDRAFT_238756 [Emiliania huxleyi CCMP1516]EOD24228.1 hypothetical protein EMIHUDRAFT_238756 [Emiliania huxleyi CCMP1516]|eukprot:XP_005776657.1 hypothetical protein EMIHUDRAFT_238756 [Emiliania huxleyi CCMP1516]
MQPSATVRRLADGPQLAASCVSSLFAFLWDVLVDWGLGPRPVRRGAANSGAAFWLRPVRALPTLWYFVGICVDLVARLTWAVYISPHQRIRRKSVEVHADDARRQPLLPDGPRPARGWVQREGAPRPEYTHDLISAALSQNIRSMTTRASAGGMHVK